MSWPTTAKCYEEIVEDLTLLQLFLPEEYPSIQELPSLSTLQFRLISEGFFAHIASPNNWRKTRVEFLTLTGLKRSGEATNLVVFITNGAGEGDLGMAMVFCHSDPAKIEARAALSAPCQQDSSDLSMVVVRRYSNTPYIPRGMSHLLYHDKGNLSRGTSSAQFPLDRLHLCQLIPFSRTELLLPHEEGEERGRNFVGGFRGGTLPFQSNFSVSPHVGCLDI